MSSVSISFDGIDTASTTIDAMVQEGTARYLATPTLTALSGQTASFLAGGEIPVPVSASDPGQVAYKEFGVRLSFTPNVRENGMINLVLEPEVSQIDPNSSYASNGFSVPGFSTRRASTTVELRDGESFVIAGLMQSTELRGTIGLPAFSEIPVVGAFFRSSELSDKNTELLIIVTPSMTRPEPRGTSVETPMDRTRASRGAELFVDGKVERNVYGLRDLLGGEGVSGHFGPILTLNGQGAFVAK
jgi:pilus assembly protein CpaC